MTKPSKARQAAMARTIAAAQRMGPRGHIGIYGADRDQSRRDDVAKILRAQRRGETMYQLPFYA